jgi:hypothetical protein
MVSSEAPLVDDSASSSVSSDGSAVPDSVSSIDSPRSATAASTAAGEAPVSCSIADEVDGDSAGVASWSGANSPSRWASDSADSTSNSVMESSTTARSRASSVRSPTTTRRSATVSVCSWASAADVTPAAVSGPSPRGTVRSR